MVLSNGSPGRSGPGASASGLSRFWGEKSLALSVTLRYSVGMENTTKNIPSSHTVKRFEDIEVGDVIVFTDRHDRVIDTDEIVSIDEAGAHFGGGTYIVAEDSPSVYVAVIA